MAWLPDEQYVYMQDTREKAITARSARHTRTHCGKGGSVKFPSDYMTKKELNAMNGKCETYRMNAPITWEEFKSWPDEHKKTYVKNLRDKYNVPDAALAEKMGTHANTFTKWMRCLNLGLGKGSGATGRHWYNTEDCKRFNAWWDDIDPDGTVEEAPVEHEENATVINEEPTCSETAAEPKSNNDKPAECYGETHTIVPIKGEMEFEGHLDDILRTVSKLLDGRKVKLKVEWEVIKD